MIDSSLCPARHPKSDFILAVSSHGDAVVRGTRSTTIWNTAQIRPPTGTVLDCTLFSASVSSLTYTQLEPSDWPHPLAAVWWARSPRIARYPRQRVLPWEMIVFLHVSPTWRRWPASCIVFTSFTACFRPENNLEFEYPWFHSHAIFITVIVMKWRGGLVHVTPTYKQLLLGW